MKLRIKGNSFQFINSDLAPERFWRFQSLRHFRFCS
jgi:hypothetical protein